MNEKENKEDLIIEEELINEESVLEEDVVEEELQLDGIEEEKIVIELEEGNLLHKIAAAALDQAVVLGCGALLLVAFDLIIRIIGFKVKSDYLVQMLLIMYFVANSLYLPLVSRLKGGRSLGKRIMNII
ncbi:MAG: hypothetical protein ACRC7N_06910 [Clostridium sp.]